MNLIIDTNIVFSSLLNPHSTVGEILVNVQDELIFFAPELLKEELRRYSQKIAFYSKLDAETLAEIEDVILSNINFVDQESISEQSWIKAFEFTKDIDENDTPFIALSLELNAKLWTGDKALSKGLSEKGVDITASTADLKNILAENRI